MVCGEPSAVTDGMTEMPLWCVDSWDRGKIHAYTYMGYVTNSTLSFSISAVCKYCILCAVGDLFSIWTYLNALLFGIQHSTNQNSIISVKKEPEVCAIAIIFYS